jgi:[ribosomal protein S5]-alanine N-acetyltransferase
MSNAIVRSLRLEISPLTADAIEALLKGNIERLRVLAGAEFPEPLTPPPYMAESLPEVLTRLRKYPAETQWWNWVVVRRDTREVVGSIALGGRPDASGAVLIGYAMYPGREGHGYATEAVRAMMGWAFEQEEVRTIRALAPVWNTPAVHVAEKVGMRPVASNEDDEVGEVLVYETHRSS